MPPIDKLAYLHLQNGKILSTRSKGKDTYYLPGGKRENGESDHAALVREIKEELSVDLIENTLQYEGTFEAQAHGHPEGIMVKMTCYSGSYVGVLKANSEIEEIIWLDYSDIDKVSAVDKVIFEWLFREFRLH